MRVARGGSAARNNKTAVASRTPTNKRPATRHRVMVEYMGLLRQAAGQPQETLLVPVGATVRDILALVREKHAGPFRSQAFDSEGELLPNIHLFLNDDDLPEEDWDKPIAHRGQLSMLLMLHPIEGG